MKKECPKCGCGALLTEKYPYLVCEGCLKVVDDRDFYNAKRH